MQSDQSSRLDESVDPASPGDPPTATAIAPPDEEVPTTVEPFEAPSAEPPLEVPEPSTIESPDEGAPEVEPAPEPILPEDGDGPDEAATADEILDAEPAVELESAVELEGAVDAEGAVYAEGAIDAAPVAAPTTVAELIAATLRAAGVRLAFTVPGESFLPLLESLERSGIRVVATRHENTAAFAAEAYGQLTGRPAACLGTRVVGAANLSIGIHTAKADSTPMFVLIGQVERGVRGREAFQEVDLVDTFGRLGVFAAEIDDAAGAAATLAEAVRRATGGRPGPVVLSVPEDALDDALPPRTTAPTLRPQPTRPDLDDVRAVLHALAGARRPVILAGGGVLRARCSNDLTRLVELLDVPVIAAWRRGDVIPNDHPLYQGMAGLAAPKTVRQRLEVADLIVVLGCRLNEATSYGYQVPRPGQRWIHVDVAPAAAPWLPAPERTVTADAKAFVRACLTRLREAALLAQPLEERRKHNRADREAWEQATVVDQGRWSGPGVHPGRVVTTLRRILPDDAIVTTDAGNFGGWVARGFRFRRPGTFLGPTSGAMGYGLPAALAAAIVHRDRPVVAMVGDGGLGMTLADLETLVREHARVVVLVFDNERYGTIRMHQDRREGAEPIGTDLGSIDFAAVARAVGARGARVDTDDTFEPALRQALAADRPTVIQLALDRRWVSVDQPATE